ncbi:MAG: hypothetical protein N3D85_01730 [Candidatus Bathyarchaeota archaeon]|nr:hypothetical protein [Candidatus Bathyarchaeota archaeon]
MKSPALVYGRKLFSIALIFNALVCIVYSIGLLTGFYTANWQLYSPFIFDGNVFWALIAVSIINIFPAAFIGQVKTGRLWFHHYIYGFLVLSMAIGFLVLFTSVSLLTLFTANITDLAVNVGRFFVLGGLALVLDDLADVSRYTAKFLCHIKSIACKGRRIIHIAQAVLSVVCLYITVGVSAAVIHNNEWATASNFIFIGTLIITIITSFWSLKRKVWYHLTPN